MAKIDTIQQTVDGIDYSININVGKNGLFTCNLDEKVAHRLGLPLKVTADKLSELKERLTTAYKIYEDSTLVSELFIEILFRAHGIYANQSNGDRFKDFTGNTHSSDIDSIKFDCKVYILEIRNGIETWFETRKGVPHVRFDRDIVLSNHKWEWEENKYYKYNQSRHKPTGVLIPYTDEALKKLESVKRDLITISGGLYSFLMQDITQITNILNNETQLRFNTQTKEPE